MSENIVQIEQENGIATIRLNRPDVRNAMNAALIGELADAVARAGDDDAVRAVVLAGAGKAFCAGADLGWMREAASYTPQENEADSMRLARLLRTIAFCPKPVVARVHGPAWAGGLGLVAAADIAIAARGASFCLSEVRIGLVPAMISPYVIRAIGARAASRYFLSAEVFDADEACRLGLVQQVVEPDALDDALATMLAALLKAGPKAMAECKRLIRDVDGRPIDEALSRETAHRIAEARASDEGREGIASFLEKREPAWRARS